jgi:hypothetical protein
MESVLHTTVGCFGSGSTRSGIIGCCQMDSFVVGIVVVVVVIGIGISFVGTGCGGYSTTTTGRILEFVNSFVFDNGGQCREHFFDVLSGECGRFEELYSVFFGELFSFFVTDDSIVIEIALVPAQDDIAIGRCTRFYVSHPSDDVIE